MQLLDKTCFRETVADVFTALAAIRHEASPHLGILFLLGRVLTKLFLALSPSIHSKKIAIQLLEGSKKQAQIMLALARSIIGLCWQTPGTSETAELFP